MKAKIRKIVKKILSLLPSRLGEQGEVMAKRVLNAYRAFNIPVHAITSAKASKENRGNESESVFKIPTYLNAARFEVSKIDSTLHPSIQPTPHEFKPSREASLIGKVFITTCSNLSRHYDLVYFVPWLKSGGADLYVINTANLMANEGLSVLVVTTESTDSPWKNRLNARIDFFELGKQLNRFDFEGKKEFLARLLLQLRVKRIHIFNSFLALDTVANYQRSLTKTIKVYISFFSDDTLDNGAEVGYINSYLTKLDQCVEYFSTDNAITPKRYEKKYGVPSYRWKVIYNAITGIEDSFIPKLGNKVLWAGRLDRGKRPDLLLKIAELMPNVMFEVYGSSVLNDLDGSILKKLESRENISMHGSYESFFSISLEDIGCFLFTSSNEGLPNVLVEAALAGVPIVGSNVGGVGDILNDQTGFPITGGCDSYIEAINLILSNKEIAKAKAYSAYKLVSNRHSKQFMTRSLRNLYYAK